MHLKLLGSRINSPKRLIEDANAAESLTFEMWYNCSRQHDSWIDAKTKETRQIPGLERNVLNRFFSEILPTRCWK